MIIIKRPTKEDVFGIQQVFYETWLSTYPNKKIGVTAGDIKEKFKNKFSEKAIKKRIDEISSVSMDNIFLVAKDGNVVVGVCKAEKKELANDLSAIYVLPSYQGKGIGIMFWKRVINFFGNEKDIIVHVATYNKKAINFYKKLGFVSTGRVFTNEIHRMPISGKLIPETELIIKN